MSQHLARVPKVVLGAALAGLVLAGCFGSEGASNLDPITPPVAESEPEGVAVSPPDAAEISTEAVGLDGPLDEFLLQIFGPSFWEVTDALVLQQMNDAIMRERGEFIAACMLESGFTYTPVIDTWRPTIPVPAPGEIPYGTREWAELWGFGVSTTPPFTSRPGWHTSGRRTRSATISNFGSPNPSEMSQAEFLAWHQAMFGITLISPPPRAERSFEGFPWPDVPEEELGCETRWHLRQVLPPTPFRALQDEIERFDSTVELDPRTLALNVNWGSCMIDAGAAVANQVSSPRQLIDSLVSANVEGQIPVEVFLEWDWDTYPEGPPPVDRTEFREREIALALADWDCREQLDYNAALWEIDLDLQQQFVQQHRDELETWVEYVGR